MGLASARGFRCNVAGRGAEDRSIYGSVPKLIAGRSIHPCRSRWPGGHREVGSLLSPSLVVCASTAHARRSGSLAGATTTTCGRIAPVLIVRRSRTRTS
jgi:hypothetical protein